MIMLFAGKEGKTSPDFYPSSQKEKTKLNRDRFFEILFGKATERFTVRSSQTKGRNHKSSGFRGGNWSPTRRGANL